MKLQNANGTVVVDLAPGERITIRAPRPNSPLVIEHNGILHNTSLITLSTPRAADEQGEYPNPAP